MSLIVVVFQLRSACRESYSRITRRSMLRSRDELNIPSHSVKLEMSGVLEQRLKTFQKDIPINISVSLRHLPPDVVASPNCARSDNLWTLRSYSLIPPMLPLNVWSNSHAVIKITDKIHVTVLPV